MALLAGVLLIGYLAHTALWPYKPCRACGGAGRLSHPVNRRALRPCRGCHTTGQQPRLAYRLYRNHRDRKENR